MFTCCECFVFVSTNQQTKSKVKGPKHVHLYTCILTHFLLFLSLSPNVASSVETLDETTETESVVSFRRERPRRRESIEQHGQNAVLHHKYLHNV